MKPPLLLSATVAATLALIGCRPAPEKEERAGAIVRGETVAYPPDSPQVAALTTQAAEPARPGRVRLTGRLVWNEEATVRIFTAFEGRVTRIMSPVGQRIEAGLPLALISSPDFGQVQADAARAALDLKQAEQTLARLQELSAVGAAPQKELRTAETELSRARSEAQRATRRLEVHAGKPNAIDQEFVLRSPIAGVVVEKNINPGQIVRPDQITANAPPLFVVTEPARLWVLLDAMEQDLPLLRVGSTVALRTPTYPEDSFTAVVEAIADAIDPASRTIKVRAAADNAQRRLKAEMYVTAEVDAPGVAGVEIPSAAVFLKGDRQYVFVEAPRGTYRRQAVQLGLARDGRQVVTKGLSVGDKVVSDGAVILDQMVATGGSVGEGK